MCKLTKTIPWKQKRHWKTWSSLCYRDKPRGVSLAPSGGQQVKNRRSRLWFSISNHPPFNTKSRYNIYIHDFKGKNKVHVWGEGDVIRSGPQHISYVSRVCLFLYFVNRNPGNNICHICHTLSRLLDWTTHWFHISIIQGGNDNNWACAAGRLLTQTLLKIHFACYHVLLYSEDISTISWVSQLLVYLIHISYWLCP